MDLPSRQFAVSDGVREAVGLIIGIVAPSGAGKTYSGLRLATGIQRVVGGDIYGIDTENGRMRYYEDNFRFKHVKLSAPFGPLDYLACMKYCASKGAKIILTDSMSHEHEGKGGVLEMHEAELERLCGDDWKKRQKLNFLAWQKPKSMRTQLMLEMGQMNLHFISTFRAKEKLKMVTGKDPIEMGYQPIGGLELVYEMVLKMLLLPGADGVPSWQSDYPGERAMMKLPEQFKPFFDRANPTQIDEQLGARLAEWALRLDSITDPAALVKEYEAATDAAGYEAAEKKRRNGWAGLTSADKKLLKDASDAADKRLKKPNEGATP